MKEYGLTLLVAAAVTYLLTPLARQFAILIGAQHAARERDVHTEPTPLLGGLAMYCGLAAGLLVASQMFPLSGIFQNTRVGSGLLLAGAVLVLMGFVDDRWGLGALTKLVGQIGAGAILVWSGAVIDWLPLPGGNTLGLTSNEGTLLTILLVVVTINAINFIDGLDGLATGIVGIGAGAFYLYYYTLAKRLGLSELADTALASAVLAGICLGFLPHNFYRARIFMGDTGSMLLGLLLAYAPISSLASIDPQSLASPAAYSGGTVNRFPEILPLLVPATILVIPYIDLLLAVVRRTRAGQSPFAADKKHLQHRLLAIGHSHRTSVLIMYLWATLFAGTVVLLSIIRTKLPILGVVTLAGFLVLLWLTMPRLRPWNRRGGSRPAPAAASPVSGVRPGGAVPANPGTANPGPVNPGPANPGPARPAAGAGGAGYDASASYRPAESYDVPGRHDPPTSYGFADPAAAAGLAALRGRDGRSAEGWPGQARREADRTDGQLADGQAGHDYLGNGYRADGPVPGGYRPGHGPPAGAGYTNGYLTSPPAASAAEPAAGTEAGPAWDRPAEPRWEAPLESLPAEPAESRWDPLSDSWPDAVAAPGQAAPAEPDLAPPAESRWDGKLEPGPDAPGEPGWAGPAESHRDAHAESPWAAPGEPRENEPDGADKPGQRRPAWPGEHPEAQESLLPWRFG